MRSGTEPEKMRWMKALSEKGDEKGNDDKIIRIQASL